MSFVSFEFLVLFGITAFLFHLIKDRTGKQAFLLCTDGFYRTLDRESLKALLPKDISGEEQLERRLRTLGAAAEKRGEQDNLSAVYCIAYGEGIWQKF